MHRSIARLFEVGNVQRVPAFFRVICQRAIGDQLRVFVAKNRVLHFEWLENILRGKLTQRFPADALYDHRQKKKTRIAVKPIASRFEVQRLLSRDDL